MMRSTVVVMASCLALSACATVTHRDAPDHRRVSCAWSRHPPGGLQPVDVPQFVCITFDDNFGSSGTAPTGGVGGIVDFFAGKRNPAGGSDAFAGTPIRCTFFHTSLYMADPQHRVHGGRTGEDWTGGNRAAWIAARAAGHEVADHTVNHLNGGAVPLGTNDLVRPRRWDAADWMAEIDACRDMLCDPTTGIGVDRSRIRGFRAPFLSFDDGLFAALLELGFSYDSSVVGSLGELRDGTDCPWPHTLDHGSPDAELLTRKLLAMDPSIDVASMRIGPHPGLWELPPTTLVIPPDDILQSHGLASGLGERVKEPTALDYSLLITDGMTAAEMRAVLDHNLDQHLAGNRAPLVFVAHSHLYAFTSARENPDTPSLAIRDERWRALSGFIEYALSKPEVRVVAAEDVVDWARKVNEASPKTAPTAPGSR
ncbi:MAG: polysaccharide deacetylase family protein [Planctomycetes bacterium]|nr:polysaccharide deacetylase family protein [Planctomycetota bacterium]